jgi:RNA polymerase sigma-70 factor (ECF subfamily)
MDAATKAEVERALEGDRDAFESLIRRYGRLVHAKAYSLLNRADLAEDAAQETFLKAWGARDRLRDPEKFPQWILSIARNVCLDGVRKKAPGPLPENFDMLRDARAPDPGRRAHFKEVRNRVFATLQELPEHYRLAATLHYIEGLDYRAIEEAMGISNGAVRGILARTLEAMRKALDPWVRSEGRPSGILPLKD